MNKALFAKVKEKTKDYGLSEKYLKAITEKLGGSVEDDSTDEDAIEATANLIASVAQDGQGEATRWADKAKKNNPPKDADKDKPDADNKDGDGGSKKDGDSKPDAPNAEIAALMARIEALEGEKKKATRSTEISNALEKHKIPSFLRERFAKSIGDDENVEDVVAAYKQECITNGLISGDPEGAKAASEKQVDEAADALLQSITAK